MSEKVVSNRMSHTILFGDDEQYTLLPLKTALYSRGYKILQAVNISDVLSALKSVKVDVLVLDIMMDPGKELEGKLDPHLAGIEALDLVKKTSPETSIICLSVIQDFALIKIIKSKGAIFLSKGETSLRTTVSIIESKITGVIVRSPHERRTIIGDE
jgi:CheY-like chemotaxis protein